MDFYQKLGIEVNDKLKTIHFQKSNCFLIEKSIQLQHGRLSKDGSLVVTTGKHTGRSAQDKYIVATPLTENTICWENSINRMTPECFDKITRKTLEYFKEQQELFITENSVGAHPQFNWGVRLITTHPHHALFSNHLFRNKIRELGDNDFTILHAPELYIDPTEMGTKSGTIIATSFDKKITIITGTSYAGEIKKSMFSVLNFLLPKEKVLPMHAGCNRLENDQVSIFFGLSGTGKTTLSTDKGTFLIGDDEHGLSENGVFNFEGGCYAKTYQLSKAREPGIYSASNRFGALIENVVMNEGGVIDFNDITISENGRSSYPLNFVDGIEPTSKGKPPTHIFFLSADAFGVLPPVSKLDKAQAMFYFLLGYTAKLAGTEMGVKEPQVTFSTCFGAPFMLLHPHKYAELLGNFLDNQNINVWLINTGWTGGPYGIGERFPLSTTRAIIRSIQENSLENTPTSKDPIFGFNIPNNVDGVPNEVLFPQNSWPSETQYKKKAIELAEGFHRQMKKFGNFYKLNILGSPIWGRDLESNPELSNI